MKQENAIETAIIDFLNRQPKVKAFKYEVKGTYSKRQGKLYKVKRTVAKGGADIIFSLQGRFCCMEVKTPAKYHAFFDKPGAHELRQREFLLEIKNTGGFIAVVCSLEMAVYFYKLWVKSISSSRKRGSSG